MDCHHGSRLRKGRISLEGHVYLVTAVTHLRRPLFADFTAGRLVVHAMKYHADQGDALTLAFCVMPNHLHWLLALSGDKGLSKVVQSVKGYSAYRLRSHNSDCSEDTTKEAEPIWQQGFHDHAIRGEEHVVEAARYLVMNPVRAGIVSNIWQYPLWDAMWIE
ncbi:REP-associated tyrosine transposase [Geomesophilobacter sediminis]|uniref:Transposase n=1 Tax=Geomesophilobacter sediminis TaxID=2798584 RepID=A0A8J7LXP0_9BACT|nr:transposase [Geomesophilobacter sediminis]MBJ6723487.1 transposase [Geomesophilobacter sediminis]